MFDTRVIDPAGEYPSVVAAPKGIAVVVFSKSGVVYAAREPY
jgi:hypothetical protein